jgi:hypothetical protein
LVLPRKEQQQSIGAQNGEAVAPGNRKTSVDVDVDMKWMWIGGIEGAM